MKKHKVFIFCFPQSFAESEKSYVIPEESVFNLNIALILQRKTNAKNPERFFRMSVGAT